MRDENKGCGKRLPSPPLVAVSNTDRNAKLRKTKTKDFLLRQMKVKEIAQDGKILSYEKIAELPVKPAEFPLVFLAYKFDFPGLIVGRHPEAQTKIEVMARFDQEEFKKYAPGDKDGFRIAPMDIDAYCRMLCKIAHAYATAELGHGSFRPVLSRFIRGRMLRQAWYWIGSDTAVPSPAEHLHDIQWSTPTIDGNVYVMISLRLFAFMGSPRYHIVVGHLLRPAEDLPLLQQPLYTIDLETAPEVGPLTPLTEPSAQA